MRSRKTTHVAVGIVVGRHDEALGSVAGCRWMRVEVSELLHSVRAESGMLQKCKGRWGWSYIVVLTGGVGYKGTKELYSELVSVF
jgi:hypothetical protein